MCFTDIIGIRGTCNEITPKYDLYLDDIDISLETLNKIVSKPYKNGQDLAEKKIEFASKLVAKEILVKSLPNYAPRSIITGKRVGITEDNLKPVAADSGFLKGMQIEICQKREYLDFYLNEIQLQVDTTGTVEVFMYDLFQNKLLDTFTFNVTTAKQQVTIFPGKTYKSNHKQMNLFIGYASEFPSVLTQTELAGCTSCGSGSSISGGGHVLIQSGKISAASDKIDQNFTGTSDTGGLSINYSLNCNYTDWLCEKAQVLSLPILYKAGIEILSYIIEGGSKQRVDETFIDRDDWILKSDKLKVMYDESIESCLNRMYLPRNSKCFQCHRRVKNIVALP